jgi:rhodanese-related sulfurtransferase
MMERHTIKNTFMAMLLPLAVVLGFANNAFASETPTTLAGGKLITAEEAKKLSDAKDATFVDTRSPINFGKGHLPGANSIGYREKSEKAANFDASADSFDFSKLPADKNTKIVFYSDSPTGWKSYKAAVLSINEGYKNVMYYRGGFADWSAKGYPAAR